MTSAMEAAVEELRERGTALRTEDLVEILTKRDDVGARNGSIRNMVGKQARTDDRVLKIKSHDGYNVYIYHPRHAAPGAPHTHNTRRPPRCDHSRCEAEPTYELALYDGDDYEYRWVCTTHRFKVQSNEHGEEVVVTRPKDLEEA